jgi:elongation factor G
MLYDDKVITQKPTAGKSSLDYDPLEAARHSSLFSHFMRVPHRNFLLQVADTPYGDFPSDAFASLDGADSAVIVVSAADGVKSGTISAFEHCSEGGIKSILALNKMDRPFLKTDEVLKDIETSLGMKPVPLQVHHGEGEDFKGVESIFVLNDNGEVKRNEDSSLEEVWVALEEAVALTNDDLLVEYLENGRIEEDKVLQGLRTAVLEGKILPVVYTSAVQDIGISELMDTIVAVLPNPIEAREEALRAACESSSAKCELQAGVEAGFAARVLHTAIDSFGSMSIIRVVSNSRQDGDGPFHFLPHEVYCLRTGAKVKMPSVITCFGLCGKAPPDSSRRGSIFFGRYHIGTKNAGSHTGE